MRLKQHLRRCTPSLFLISCLFGGQTSAWSQHTALAEVNLQGQRIEDANPSLDRQFKHYEVYELDQDLSSASALQDGSPMHVTLNLSEALHWDLELVQNHLFASDARIQTASNGIYRRLEKPECNTYMGSPASGTTNSVRLNLSEDGFWGMLPNSDAPGEAIYIEPLRNFDESAPAHQYVVYDPEDVLGTATTSCMHDHVQHTRQTVIEPGASGRLSGSTDCFGVEVVVAVDYSAFNLDQESTSNVINRYTGVLNIADGYYDVFDIDFIINDFFISESFEDDPWTTSTDGDVLLDDFGVWANSYFTYYDVASLWTYRGIQKSDGTLLGGIASGRPCLEEKSRNVMKVGSYVSDLILPQLWSHEIGHNLSYGHDPVGAPYIMRESGTFMDVTEFSAESQQVINDYISNNDCLKCIAPDLIPLLSTNDEELTVDWGSQYTLTASVQNIGVLTAGASLLRCYWSDDAQWDQNDQFLGQSSFPSMNRDVVVNQSLTIQIPAGGQSQLKYIIYVADATDLVDERTEENNNVLAIPVILTDPTNPHDLQVSIDQQSLPTVIEPGSVFQTSMVVSLSGVYQASLQNLTSYGVKLFLSHEETIGSGSIELGSLAISSMQPQATQLISMTTQIPSSVSYGAYQLIAQVDVWDQVNERNEFNNHGTAPIQLSAPDLIMDDVLFELPGSQTPNCHVSGKVRNQNDLPAGTSSLGVSVMIKPAGNSFPFEVVIGNYAVPGIGAQGFHEFSHSFFYTPPANHEIVGVRCRADVLNEVEEENESNNMVTLILTSTLRHAFSIADAEVTRLYPNPASDLVMLRFEQTDWAAEEVELSVMNSSGQQLLQSTIPGNTFYTDFDVSDYPSGTYQVMLYQGDQLIYHETLIKP